MDNADSRNPGTRMMDHVLSAIIILALFTPWVYNSFFVQPVFYQNYDPEIQYFMNSLLAFKGQTYFYVDHPGTPLEVIGSLILALTYPFISGGLNHFILYHLKNPGLFLTLAHLFITLASIGCALYMKKLLSTPSRRWGDSLVVLALPLMFYTVHPMSLETLNLWSHASFNFPLGTLLLLVFYRIAGTGKELTFRNLLALGLSAGILTSVMVYFSAWFVGAVVFIVVWHRMQRFSWGGILSRTLVFVLSGASGFVLMLIPAFHRLTYFFNWMVRLMFHQGIYGEGPEGITTVPLMASSLSSLFQAESYLLILSAVFAVTFISLLIWKRKDLGERAGLWSFGLGVLIQMGILLLLVLKHPMDRYLLPLAAMLPVFAMLILQGLDDVPRARQIFIWAMVLLVFILFPITFQKSLADQYSAAQQTKTGAAQNRQIMNDFLRRTGKNKAVVLWTYGTASPCYALQFGNEYTGLRFSDELSIPCKNQYEFNIWTQKAIVDISRLPIDRTNWDMIFTTESILNSYGYLEKYGTRQDYPDDIVVIYNAH
jgi:hypothetical protein